MKSSVEPLEGNKVKLYVEVDEAEFDKDIDRAFRTIAREVKLPGFRNGKVPRRVLEARIGLGPAREQALRDSIPQYLGKAVREHDVDLIATPSIEITGGQEEGVVEFEAECEIRPEITVPGYGGLRIELDSPVPTEEEVEEAIQRELRASGSLTTVDRPAQRGDFLTLDIAATRDGVEVPGLVADDFTYELGQGWITDDFDDQLEGASAGDTLTFTSTPKETQEPADFTVTVTAVQELTVPELTDEWVADNSAEYETVAEWTESLRSLLSETRLVQVRRTVVDKVTDALVGLVDVDPPASMVQAEQQRQFENMVRQLQAQGVDVQAWLSATGRDPQELFDAGRPAAEKSAKVDLALRAVATAEGLEATEDDLEREFAMMAMQFGQKAKEIRKLYERNDALPELMAQIRKSKAMDWLLHHVEMVDHDGNQIDRDLVLGHTHDDEHDHDHDHDHEGHDDHDHDHADSDAADAEQGETA